MSTSTTQNPSDALVVQTATGFNQGDMVYFRGDTNSYASTAGLTATGNGNFNAAETTGLMSNGAGGMVRPVFGFTDGFVNQGLTGGSRQAFASVLTNGNIVQVYINDSGVVHFQIVTTAGVVVVPITIVSTTFAESAANPGVTALTGGGFVVYWINATGGTTNRPCYAIYSNTGVVVTAPVNDTAIGATVISNTPLRGTALQNGGFALVTADTGGNVRFRAYNAVGTGAYAWTQYTTATLQITQNGVSIASRSDNSIIIVFRSSQTVIRYSIRNTSGGSIVDTSINTTSNSARATGVATLADGTTFVLGYNNGTTQTNCVRLLPISNTLGAEIQVPAANCLSSTNTNTNANTFHSLLGLASGNFVYAFTDFTLAIQFVVFNSSGVPISGTNTLGAVPRVIPSSRNSVFNSVTMLEYGGNINFYWTPSNDNALPNNQSWARVNTTTYEPVYINSSSQLITSVSAPLGAPVVASAAPNSMPFFAGSSSTSAVTGALPTSGTAPAATPVVAATCRALASATLPNGKVLIAYQRISDNSVSVNRYSISMVLEQTISIGTGIATNNYLKISALPSGGFSVGYFTSATVYTVATYNSSAVLLGSAINSNVSNGTTVGLGLIGLTSNRTALVYRPNSSTNLVDFVVIDGTTGGVILTASNALNNSLGNVYTSVAAAADNAGGFFVAAADATAATIDITAFTCPTGVTYNNNGMFQSSGGNTSANATAFFTPGGNFVYSGQRNSSFDISAYNVSNSSIASSSGPGVTVGTSSIFAANVTGNGSIAAAWNSGGNYNFLAYTGGVAAELNTTNNVASSSVSGYTVLANPLICITPGQGYNAIIAWLDASNSPVFINVNMFPFRTTASVVAGVSVTNAVVPIFPNTSPITPAVNNSVLTGVAGTTAAAGGSGVVLTRGNTQLNTSYSNSTVAQGFDHQSPNGTAMPGVKGYIVGRNVTLQGAE